MYIYIYIFVYIDVFVQFIYTIFRRTYVTHNSRKFQFNSSDLGRVFPTHNLFVGV